MLIYCHRTLRSKDQGEKLPSLSLEHSVPGKEETDRYAFFVLFLFLSLYDKVKMENPCKITLWAIKPRLGGIAISNANVFPPKIGNSITQFISV